MVLARVEERRWCSNKERNYNMKVVRERVDGWRENEEGNWMWKLGKLVWRRKMLMIEQNGEKWWRQWLYQRICHMTHDIYNKTASIILNNLFKLRSGLHYYKTRSALNQCFYTETIIKSPVGHIMNEFIFYNRLFALYKI